MTKEMFWQRAFIILIGVFIFRLGSHLPVPMIDPYALSLYVKQFDGTMIEILNTFSGGSVKRFSILAVGIMPYISASIIIQMFGFFSSHLKQLKSEGERGNIKINKYVRQLALALTVIQAFSITTLLSSQSVNGLSLVQDPNISFYIISVLSLTSGSMFLIWLGERLTDYGIGSGISTIIFAGIVSNMPETLNQLATLVNSKEISVLLLMLIIGLFFSLMFLIVKIEYSQRRISLATTNSYNEETYLPIKINVAGIMPAIFATTLIFIPLTFNRIIFDATNVDIMSELQSVFGDSKIYYLFAMSGMIMFFTYFYSNIIFNPKNTADHLQSSGSFIKGIRPGKPTEKFLKDTLKRLCFIGGSFIVIITILPEILVSYFSIPFYLGGTSLLIMVLITKEWYEQYELSNHKNKYEKVKNNLMSNFK